MNDSSPAQVANAVLYNTYEWDSNGIYNTRPRVPGRSFMACNLGATSSLKGDRNSFGMYYQWGRKDPFLPIKSNAQLPDASFFAYTSNYIQAAYNNNASLIPMTSTIGNGELFQTVRIDASTGNIHYAIQHPTIFMATAEPASFQNLGEPPTHNPDLYVNNGDWRWGHDDTLWGGIPFSEAPINYNNIVANNGAEHKSLFDPCPSGWMLPPSDSWMGFTINGMNQSDIAKENYQNVGTELADHGMVFYMQNFKSGATSFFPFCGWRTGEGSCFVVDGCSSVVKGCGGYYTSAASFNHATSIFHFHASLVSPFDYGYQYSRRSCAYPVRCVRETK